MSRHIRMQEKETFKAIDKIAADHGMSIEAAGLAFVDAHRNEFTNFLRARGYTVAGDVTPTDLIFSAAEAHYDAVADSSSNYDAEMYDADAFEAAEQSYFEEYDRRSDNFNGDGPDYFLGKITGAIKKVGKGIAKGVGKAAKGVAKAGKAVGKATKKVATIAGKAALGYVGLDPTMFDKKRLEGGSMDLDGTTEAMRDGGSFTPVSTAPQPDGTKMAEKVGDFIQQVKTTADNVKSAVGSVKSAVNEIRNPATDEVSEEQPAAKGGGIKGFLSDILGNAGAKATKPASTAIYIVGAVVAVILIVVIISSRKK